MLNAFPRSLGDRLFDIPYVNFPSEAIPLTPIILLG